MCRSPIDSVVTKGDLVGLYNQCVTVSLGDGRVVEQNIYPGETHCQSVFKQAWRMLLNSQWNQVGWVLIDRIECVCVSVLGCDHQLLWTGPVQWTSQTG